MQRRIADSEQHLPNTYAVYTVKNKRWNGIKLVNYCY